MPKTAMYKNEPLTTVKDYIGTARQVRFVKAISIAFRV